VPDVRVLLIAEQRMLADALSERLGDEPGLTVTSEDGTDRQHLEQALVRSRPGVVVTSDLTVGRAVAQRRPDVALVVLAPVADSAHAVAAARAGAVAWLPMSSGVDELVAVVRAAAEGRAHYPDLHLAEVLRELRRDVDRARAPRGPLHLLSERERDVLNCLAQGRSNKEIARALSMSGNTVRTHVRNIFRKLEVHSRLEAVRVARTDTEDVGEVMGERMAPAPGVLHAVPTPPHPRDHHAP
jgi:two-component system, NarL family, response regulator LiaR